MPAVASSPTGMPTGAPDFSVGQTAFIVGSHKMEMCAHLMDESGNGRPERDARLIRPHVEAGDVVLFDCRVLHFGTANRSGEKGAPGVGIQRPLLYANVQQRWFEDKKNWTLTSLFKDKGPS